MTEADPNIARIVYGGMDIFTVEVKEAAYSLLQCSNLITCQASSLNLASGYVMYSWVCLSASVRACVFRVESDVSATLIVSFHSRPHSSSHRELLN